MAKRPPPRAEPTEPVFTSEHIEKAIARFHRRLAELDKFNPDDIRDRQDPSIAALEVAIEEALVKLSVEVRPAIEITPRFQLRHGSSELCTHHAIKSDH